MYMYFDRLEFWTSFNKMKSNTFGFQISTSQLKDEGRMATEKVRKCIGRGIFLI